MSPRPTRFSAQSEAISLIFNAKTSSNPESAVGLMNMGGSGPEVLVTPGTDIGRVLAGLHQTKIKGSVHLGTAISIAMLALKHRQNKSQRQRIVAFVCSELGLAGGDKGDNEKELVRLAKKCKKNNVSVDFVAFGDAVEGNTKGILEKFVEAVGGSSGEGSYLAVVPPGPNLLSDAIITTPIVSMGAAGDGGAGDGFGDANGAGGGGSGGGGFEFGIDPSADPELAMALRMSMEEEENRLDRERRAREDAERQRMEGIPEEGQSNGEAGGSDANPSRQPTVEDEKKDGDADGSGDRMDTA